jgi:hypothetical protein
MITIDCTRPSKLFRYARCRWNVKSLIAGEFRLVPASEYGELKGDAARQDNELVREGTSPGGNVTVTHVATGKPIRVIGDVTYRHEVGTDYYTLCLSSAWDPPLFDEFKGSNSCLVIHNPEEFCERVHFHAEKLLKEGTGIDAAVSYLAKSQLGPAFSKHWKFLPQKEWRFAWYPPAQVEKLPVKFISIGNIEQFAEIVRRPEVR